MAKMLFTDIGIKRIREPETGRIEITDEHPDVKGFTLRVTANRAKTFNLVFRSPRNGKQARIDLGTYPATSLASARDKAKAYRGLIEEGIDPRDHEVAEAKNRAEVAKGAALAAEQHANGQFQNVASDFVAVCRDKRKLRQWSEYERRFQKYVLPPWTGRHVHEITREDCRALLTQIEANHGPVMANRVLATVRSLYAWLIEQDRVALNPASNVRSDTVEQQRDRVLSDGELAAVWHACDGLSQIYTAYLRILILTAQRRAEVASMRWCDIDLDACLWTLPRQSSKMDRAHSVPLTPMALEILKALPRFGSAGPDAFVFTTNVGKTHISAYSKIKTNVDTIIAAQAKTGEAAKVGPWRVHDLRRTAASGMARLGVALHVIEKALGHEGGTISGVAAIYNRHGYDREKRAALETWASHVAVITDTSGKVMTFARSAS